MPREVIFNPAFLSQKNIAKYMREKLACTADLMEDKFFSPVIAREKVLAQFGKESLDDLALAGKPRCVRALGALLQYVCDTQKYGLERLCTLRVREGSKLMALDQNARANLELLQTLRSGEKKGSLLWVLDKTRTPMGKRLIKTWIVQPLVSPAEIDKRLNAVEELFREEMLAADVCESLSGVFDLERLMTRIVYASANPREYKTLEQGIGRLPGIRELIRNVKSNHLIAVYRDIDPLEDVGALLARSIKDDAPVTLRDCGVIAPGYSEELDYLRELVSGSKDVLARMEAAEREKTGIKNLKIAYNKVFGYYIEVTKSYLNMVPDTYIRKQTLANCERYVIQELKELEEQLLSANDKAVTLEHRLFEEVRVAVAENLPRIQRTAIAIARLDVYLSFARVARESRYVRPEVNLGDGISIRAGRHPVVEQLLGGAPFVPNDADLNTADRQISVVTGPNMGGKSTYMRQTALIVLMAQIGSFVPAEYASIGVADGIYTRIGASDDLTAGQSTFMVEMVEVADILKKATGRSLLLLDEIGRGTSTYDGMSIARAVMEYIADKGKLGAKTLFATHYHELTGMEQTFPCVKNLHVAVKKRGEGITFLYKIVPGGADDSYGVEVAALAGIPDWIVKRAHEVLADLEENHAIWQSSITTCFSQSLKTGLCTTTSCNFNFHPGA
jgi:DNA mismatch repair protein MutS